MLNQCKSGMLTDGMFLFFFKDTVNAANHWGVCTRHWLTYSFSERQQKLVILCQMGLLIAKMGGWINESLGSWLMGWLFEDVVNRTNHWGACTRKWLTHILLLQRNGENFSFFFPTAGRSHFYIQPEGLWQIMCQGFMMWDVIGPSSWWSKWMCISQTVTSPHLLRGRRDCKPCCVARSPAMFAVQPHVQLVHININWGVRL